LTFARHRAITDILVVVPPGWREIYSRSVLRPLEKELGDLLGKIHEPVVGGSTRQDSARAGLTAALHQSQKGSEEQIPVLIHDAARPIVRSEVVSDLLTALRDAHREGPGVAGVVPVLAVGDTLKVIRGQPQALGELYTGQVERTIPRAGLWRVQTPQAFYLGPILEAHQQALLAGTQSSDDAMLFERMGWPVEVVPGTPLSLKVTHPEDLALVEGWLTSSAGTPLPARHGGRRCGAPRRAPGAQRMLRSAPLVPERGGLG
jgi:2-C-methyl-D-erythritol 4-phosphate cytidylyltransferase/2-C-methyl-D-erythritol 2,4-cyclodiphosphate synthase